MGHVPTRSFPLFGEGSHVSRREYRRGRPTGNPDLAIRSTGEFGEILACGFLVRHGLTILARNVRVSNGEIDIVARAGSSRVIVEVRTLNRSRHPLDAVDERKRKQVRRLAQMVGVVRCDLIGVGLLENHYVVHWERNAF